MSDTIIRAFDAVVDDVKPADRTLVARINTAAVDRYKTVIDPRGGRLENYRKNPAVLWEHGKDPRRFTDPIGRNLWIRHDGGPRPTKLLARTKFLDDDFSQQRFEWYRDGVLNAFSVNILPDAEATGPPTRDEVRAAPEWEAAQTVYRGWDLAEYSGTTIPGNADCLVADRAARMLELVGRDLLWLPQDVMEMARARIADAIHAEATMPRRVDMPPDEVIRRIVKKAGKYYVFSEDGTKRLGGPYATRQQAAKRLQQVEYFKHKDGERAAPIPEPEPELPPPPKGLGSFERVLLTLMTEQRAADERRLEDMMARIELQVFGRV